MWSSTLQIPANSRMNSTKFPTTLPIKAELVFLGQALLNSSPSHWDKGGGRVVPMGSGCRFAGGQLLDTGGGEWSSTDAPVAAFGFVDDDPRHLPHVLAFDGD